MTPLFVTLAFVAASLVALHYIQWERFIGRRLPPLAAYVLGVSAFVGPWSALVWEMQPHGQQAVIWLLWCVGVAGATTGLTYLMDWLAEEHAQAEMAKVYRDELKKRMDHTGADD